MYRDICFSASSELTDDVYAFHGLDYFEEIKRGIDLAISGFAVETVVDLVFKTVKFNITKKDLYEMKVLDI